MPLTSVQSQRYARHLTLPGFGSRGQEQLLGASVLLVGAGGLGCPLALYLAAAGVGRLGIIDFDVVEVSNLQRQVLHRTQDLGLPKARSAGRAVNELNPEVQVEVYEEALTAANALALVAAYDLIIDGTDNFPTRYLINDACVLLGKPNIHGSIYRFEGQATVFDSRREANGSRRGPCYRCLYPEPPPPGELPACAEAGVLGVLPGLIAMIQATEAIKLLTGLGRPLTGRLLRYDAVDLQFRELRIRPDPACPVCGSHPTITTLVGAGRPCALEPDPAQRELSVADYAALRARGDEHLLLDVREPFELELCQIEGSVSIPLAQLAGRLAELAAWKDRLVVCQCKSGRRSLKALETLRQHGFAKVVNLSGGILAWGMEIDPSINAY